ncbi:MAG: hypothetical protein KGH54_03925 [Candidatus Micrarchaeota archaeon]|nr:hypothetical protein [Candidatus Micrarchaeota archaeon]
MASVQNLLEIARDGFGSNVNITAITCSLGRLIIDAENKAITIEGKKSVEDEIAKMRKGMGIESSTVADYGEDIITEAALGVVKYALYYGQRLDDVKKVVLVTESGLDLSKNPAISVIKLVNEIGNKLRESGHEIGTLSPNVRLSGQSACVSGVANLADMAVGGSLGSGKMIIVTTDNALYKYGDKADETGGFGVTVTTLEGSEAAKGKGLSVSASMMGSQSRDVWDFYKPILNMVKKETGIDLVSKFAIVNGDHSEYAYLSAAIGSLKKAFIGREDELRDFDAFKKKYVLVPHIPYPTMPRKDIAYMLRHFSRHDTRVRETMEAQVGGKEPFLEGFDNLEGELKFIVDIQALFTMADGILKLVDRLDDPELRRKVLDKSNTHAKDIAEGMIQKLEEIEKRYRLCEKLKNAVHHAKANLTEVMEGREIMGGGIYDVVYSFNRINKIINAFIEKDKEYTKRLREAPLFCELAADLKIDEAIALSKKTGNIYTGSAFLALMSYIANTENNGKDIIFFGYGSGYEGYVCVLRAREIEEMRGTIRSNIQLEFKNKEPINAEQYTRIRDGAELHNRKAVKRYFGSSTISKEMVTTLANEIASVKKPMKILAD